MNIILLAILMLFAVNTTAFGMEVDAISGRDVIPNPNGSTDSKAAKATKTKTDTEVVFSEEETTDMKDLVKITVVVKGDNTGSCITQIQYQLPVGNNSHPFAAIAKKRGRNPDSRGYISFYCRDESGQLDDKIMDVLAARAGYSAEEYLFMRSDYENAHVRWMFDLKSSNKFKQLCLDLEHDIQEQRFKAMLEAAELEDVRRVASGRDPILPQSPRSASGAADDDEDVVFDEDGFPIL